jgi:glycosyltransferase involved in cell wall biosynthesis
VDKGLIRVVRNGVDPDRYRPAVDSLRARTRAALGVPDGAPLLLYAGRLVPQKGIDVLLEAFLRLRQSLPGAKLVLAGCARPPGTVSGDSERELRRRQGPWTWAPPAEDMVPYYGAADLVVVPSTWREPLSRVPLEAMACGRPVAASSIGGIPEAFDDSLRRLLVEPANAEALAAKLLWAARWRSHSPDLDRACRDHIRRHFTLARTLDGVEEALSAARDEHRRRLSQGRTRQMHEWAKRFRSAVQAFRSETTGRGREVSDGPGRPSDS